jgi:hypothetical protein
MWHCLQSQCAEQSHTHSQLRALFELLAGELALDSSAHAEAKKHLGKVRTGSYSVVVYSAVLVDCCCGSRMHTVISIE